MADYGIKVSKAGFDVKTTADKNLILTSKYPVLKVKMQGSGSVTVSGGNGVATITHNLGYRPIIIAFCDNAASGGDRVMVPSRNRVVGGSADLSMKINVNDVKLYVVGGPDDGNYDYYYYIFYDPVE